MFSVLSFRKSLLLALALLPMAPGIAHCDGSRLAVGDEVLVAVDGEKDFSMQYQINRDGCISLPMNLKPLKIVGLNTTDAAAALTKSLGERLVDPQVSVSFVDRAKMQVFVVGQVKKPGIAIIGVGDRVLQALAQADYDDTADLSRVSLRRGDKAIPVDLTTYLSGQDLNVNLELEAGDTIVVPRVDTVGTVMVLGQVAKVGAIPITRGMTFKELMGLVGDVTVEADKEKITIKREGALDPIHIDYKRSMEGDPSADIALQPKDTIFVPQIETAFITVMGGVNRPGQYPLKGKLTLSEALGLAGGPVPKVGDTRKIQIVRAPAPGAALGETLSINLQKINDKGEAEPLMKRGDVVSVAVHKDRSGILDVIRDISPLGWLLRL